MCLRHRKEHLGAANMRHKGGNNFIRACFLCARVRRVGIPVEGVSLLCGGGAISFGLQKQKMTQG